MFLTIKDQWEKIEKYPKMGKLDHNLKPQYSEYIADSYLSSK